MFLPVIGIDPDLILAAMGAVRGPPHAANRPIDPPQRPVGEGRARPATMRLLVVAEEVQMDDRQTAGHVEPGADDHQFPQEHADGDARRHQSQLLPQVSSGHQSACAIDQGQGQFGQHHAGDADGTVEIKEQKHGEAERMDAPPPHAIAPFRGAEVGFLRAAGVDVAIGAAVAEQCFAQQAQAGLNLRGGRRIEHADGVAGLAVAILKTRHGARHAVEQLALDHRRRRGQPAVEGRQAILFPPQQSAKKREPAAPQRPLKLKPRQPVNLD